MTHSYTTLYPGAQIAEGARIQESCRIDPGAQISAEAVLGSAVVICQNVQIRGAVRLARAVNVREHAILIGPLTIGAETYIAPETVIGAERADQSAAEGQTTLLNNCLIGRGAQVAAGVHIGQFARVRAGSRVIGDVPSYAVAGRAPAILECYACPQCGRPLRVVRAFREIVDAHCDRCKADKYRFSKRSWGTSFNRVLLPGGALGETVNTTGDDPRWLDAVELS